MSITTDMPLEPSTELSWWQAAQNGAVLTAWKAALACAAALVSMWSAQGVARAEFLFGVVAFFAVIGAVGGIAYKSLGELAPSLGWYGRWILAAEIEMSVAVALVAAIVALRPVTRFDPSDYSTDAWTWGAALLIVGAAGIGWVYARLFAEPNHARRLT